MFLFRMPNMKRNVLPKFFDKSPAATEMTPRVCKITFTRSKINRIENLPKLEKFVRFK